MLCQTDPSRITHFLNVEGNLTEDDAFISSQAAAVADTEFESWFRQQLIANIVPGWFLGTNPRGWPSFIRYLGSLALARADAFHAGAKELVGGIGPAEDGSTKIARRYQDLTVSKAYCWGTDSLSRSSRSLLKTKNVVNCAFAQASHWVMIDQPEAFYGFLAGFLST